MSQTEQNTTKTTAEYGVLGGFFGAFGTCLHQGPKACAVECAKVGVVGAVKIVADQTFSLLQTTSSMIPGPSFEGDAFGYLPKTIEYKGYIVPGFIALGSGYLAYSRFNQGFRALCGFDLQPKKEEVVVIREGDREDTLKKITRTPCPKGIDRIFMVLENTFSSAMWATVSGMVIYGGYRSIYEMDVPN